MEKEGEGQEVIGEGATVVLHEEVRSSRDMYEDSEAGLRRAAGVIDGFNVGVGLHRL